MIGKCPHTHVHALDVRNKQEWLVDMGECGQRTRAFFKNPRQIWSTVTGTVFLVPKRISIVRESVGKSSLGLGITRIQKVSLENFTVRYFSSAPWTTKSSTRFEDWQQGEISSTIHPSSKPVGSTTAVTIGSAGPVVPPTTHPHPLVALVHTVIVHQRITHREIESLETNTFGSSRIWNHCYTIDFLTGQVEYIQGVTQRLET